MADEVKTEKPAGDPAIVFSDAQKTELMNIINGSVGGAVATHLSRGKVRESMNEMIKASISEAIAGFKPKEEPAPPKGDNQNPNDGQQLPDSVKRQLEALKLENKKLQDEFAAQRETATQEKEKARVSTERSQLLDALVAGGVQVPMARAAAAMLHSDQKRIKTADDGSVLFTIVSPTYGPEEHPIAKGVSEWLKSEEGKSFLPPVTTTGAGAGTGKAPTLPRPGDKGVNLRNLKTEVGKALMGPSR